MKNINKTPHKYLIIYLFILGISLGWLVGMSASPVLAIILGSIISLIATIVSVLTGINFNTSTQKSESEENQKPFQKNINIAPLSFLVLFIALGTALGLFCRTNDIFGIQPNIFANKWKGSGFDDKDLKNNLLKYLYLTFQKKSETNMTSNEGSLIFHGVLFASTADDCGSITSKHGVELKNSLLALNDSTLTILVRNCNDSSALEIIKDIICKSNRK